MSFPEGSGWISQTVPLMPVPGVKVGSGEPFASSLAMPLVKAPPTTIFPPGSIRRVCTDPLTVIPALKLVSTLPSALSLAIPCR